MTKRKSVTGLKKRRKPPPTATAEPAPLDAPNPSQSNRAASSRITRRQSRPDTTSDAPALSNLSGNKRRRHEVEDSEDDDGPPSKKFAVLKPRLKYVRQDIIKNKWEVLPDHIQTRVKELFVAVGRPVITQYRDERRRIDAQTALSSITRKLGERLPRMPFPPSTKEVSFDHEALLNSNRTLEQQLTPALHTIALLKGHIIQEEQALAAERSALEELRKNAKAEETFRKRHIRKRHGALRLTPLVKEEAEDSADLIGFAPNPSERLPSLHEILDSALQPVVMQLRSHLESMEGNAEQVAGISDALCATTAVLDDALFNCLDRSAYGSLLHR
ncbi:hypothetical protein MMC30_007381 [Trapelia coarctata]|nr:hypothetical protein [Trapelia coarctata]